ncbi:DUF3465 domain-containing protein [Shewanella donghaensis]|uniref:DUF3465 domain-containing protein n=1 Tax=Shewanella donghaensis TaxID=238836 RepID=UPI001183436E
MLNTNNIVLALRMNPISMDDAIQFYGKFDGMIKVVSWCSLVHWTHRDPNGKHIHGWLKHNDKMF